MRLLRTLLLALAAALAASPVGAEEGAAPKMLNEPTAVWTVYGPGQTHKARRDGAVQGGRAMRVAIAAKPANAWDIGASLPIERAIAKGDRLILAFWVRIESGDTAAGLGAAIQQNSAPYAPIVAGRVALTNAWQLVHIKGIAEADFPAGKANVALTLGDAARAIDLGPAFVMKAD